MFVNPDEAETGSAGEQPARNNQENWNVQGVELTSTSFKKNIPVRYALKNSWGYTLILNLLSFSRWGSTF
jgi:hypothetical protein